MAQGRIAPYVRNNAPPPVWQKARLFTWYFLATFPLTTSIWCLYCINDENTNNMKKMLCCKHSWWSFCYPLIPSGDYSKGIILLSGEYWSYHRSPPTHLDPWWCHLQYLLYWYCYWIYNHPSTYLPWAEIITSRCKAAFFATIIIIVILIRHNGISSLFMQSHLFCQEKSKIFVASRIVSKWILKDSLAEWKHILYPWFPLLYP